MTRHVEHRAELDVLAFFLWACVVGYFLGRYIRYGRTVSFGLALMACGWLFFSAVLAYPHLHEWLHPFEPVSLPVALIIWALIARVHVLEKWGP